MYINLYFPSSRSVVQPPNKLLGRCFEFPWMALASWPSVDFPSYPRKIANLMISGERSWTRAYSREHLVKRILTWHWFKRHHCTWGFCWLANSRPKLSCCAIHPSTSGILGVFPTFPEVSWVSMLSHTIVWSTYTAAEMTALLLKSSCLAVI